MNNMKSTKTQADLATEAILIGLYGRSLSAIEKEINLLPENIRDEVLERVKAAVVGIKKDKTVAAWAARVAEIVINPDAVDRDEIKKLAMDWMKLMQMMRQLKTLPEALKASFESGLK